MTIGTDGQGSRVNAGVTHMCLRDDAFFGVCSVRTRTLCSLQRGRLYRQSLVWSVMKLWE